MKREERKKFEQFLKNRPQIDESKVQKIIVEHNVDHSNEHSWIADLSNILSNRLLSQCIIISKYRQINLIMEFM